MEPVVKRISKRLRDLAAMIPALCANNNCGYAIAEHELDLAWNHPAVKLADAAWDVVYDGSNGAYRNADDLFAETEALIRSGWSPGETP